MRGLINAVAHKRKQAYTNLAGEILSAQVSADAANSLSD
jgi:hypothetical protein